MDNSRVFEDADLTEEELAYLKGGNVEVPDTPAGADPAPTGQDTPQPQKAADEAEIDSDEHSEEGDEEITEISRAPNGRFARKVPIHALHKERAGHKATKEALNQSQVKFARAEERMNMLLELAQSGQFNQQPGAKPEAAKPKSPMDEPDIDVAEDFVGALDQQKRRMAYLQKTMVEERTQRETQHTEAQVRTAYLNDAKQFVAKEAAFPAAYKHVVSARHAQLKAVGVEDEGQRNAMIAQEERDLVHQAFKAGKSPAQVLWDYALGSGFVKPSGTPQPSAQPNTDQHAANVAKIAAQKKGQAASASLSGVGGSPRSLTLAQIADMDDEDFSKFVDQMGGARKFSASYFE
jgi:hypothetical protein